MTELARHANRVMVLQIGLTLIVCGTVFCWVAFSGESTSVALRMAAGAGYGGMLGIVSTMLSRRSVERSARAAVESTSLAMVPVYVGLLNKLLIVGGGLAVGLIALRLSPLSLVAGYIVSQLALVVLMIRTPEARSGDQSEP